MKRAMTLVFALILAASWALAQEDASTEPSSSAEKSAATPADGEQSAEAAAPEEAVESDIVYLKTGKQIRGQVVQRTPASIKVEVALDVYLELPRKQVDHVDYDKNKGGMRDAQAREAEGDKQDLIPGKKLSAELHKKLNKDISIPPLKSDGRRFKVILEDLSARAGVPIIMDPPVGTLTAQDRKWEFEAAPGATLLSLLEDDMKQKLPKLDVIYQYEEVHITTKEAAAAAANAEGQAAPPAEAGQPASEPPPPPAASPAPDETAAAPAEQ